MAGLGLSKHLPGSAGSRQASGGSKENVDLNHVAAGKGDIMIKENEQSYESGTYVILSKNQDEQTGAWSREHGPGDPRSRDGSPEGGQSKDAFQLQESTESRAASASGYQERRLAKLIEELERRDIALDEDLKNILQ